MNVVHLLTFLDSQTGGMERQALQLVLRLRSQGVRAFFITCTHRKQMRREHLPWHGHFHDVEIYRIPLIAGWGRLNALMYLVGAVGLLVYLRRRYRVIHAHQLHTSGFVAALAKTIVRTKKLVVKNCCGGSFGDVRNVSRLPFARFAIYLMKRSVDRWIAISEETQREMEELSCSHIALIPNGVDTEYFFGDDEVSDESLCNRYAPDSSTRIVLFVGKLDPQKNVGSLIEAMARVENAVLLIVGTGALQKTLEQVARSSKVSHRVHWCGTTIDVRPFYRMADVLALPSFAEGSPNVLLEALSMGTVCVGSDIASVRALIEDGRNGYLSACDAVSIASTLQRALRESTPDVSRRARETILRHHDFKTITKRYATLYRELCYPEQQHHSDRWQT